MGGEENMSAIAFLFVAVLLMAYFLNKRIERLEEILRRIRCDHPEWFK